MSELIGVTIERVDISDNNFYGVMGGTYYDGSDNEIANLDLYQEAYVLADAADVGDQNVKKDMRETRRLQKNMRDMSSWTDWEKRHIIAHTLVN